MGLLDKAPTRGTRSQISPEAMGVRRQKKLAACTQMGTDETSVIVVNVSRLFDVPHDPRFGRQLRQQFHRARRTVFVRWFERRVGR